MGRAEAHLDFVETGWSDAGGHLRQRQTDKGGHPWQRTYRHQYHASGLCHQRHSCHNSCSGTYRHSWRGSHLLRRLRPIPHGERRGLCQPTQPGLGITHAERRRGGATTTYPMDSIYLSIYRRGHQLLGRTHGLARPSRIQHCGETVSQHA